MRKLVVVLLLLTLVVLIGVGFILTNPDQGNDLSVALGLATPQPEIYRLTGILEAETFSLVSTTGGRVRSVPISEGERVAAGQVLATLDPSLLEAQRAVVAAQQRSAEARLKALQAGARPVDLAVAQALVDQAEAGVAGAEQALEDARASTPVSLRDERVALAQATLESAEADLLSAQAMLAVVEAGPTQSDLDAARAALEARTSALAALDDQIADLTLSAPQPGVLLEQLLLPGELALPGWPILTLAEPDVINLTVFIPEADLDWVHLGDPAWLAVDSYPGRWFLGEVTRVADQAEYTPRNVQTPQERVILVYAVEIRISNLDGALKPGMTAVAHFRRSP